MRCNLKSRKLEERERLETIAREIMLKSITQEQRWVYGECGCESGINIKIATSTNEELKTFIKQNGNNTIFALL